MLIIWSRDANDELAGIIEYFTNDDKVELGLDIVDDIFSSADKLADYPLMGHTGRWHGTRELVCATRPYIIIYEIIDDAIHILRVKHTSRLYPTIP